MNKNAGLKRSVRGTVDIRVPATSEAFFETAARLAVLAFVLLLMEQ